MSRRTESSCEVFFARTRDGLVVSRVTLRPIDEQAEHDLRLFAQRIVGGLVVSLRPASPGPTEAP